MLPVLFRIPGLDLPIYGYGVMLAIGFLLAVEVGRRLANLRGMSPDFITNIAMVCLVSGILGARLLFILQYPSTVFSKDASFGENLFSAVNLAQGGLVYYGGFLGALGAGMLYCLWKKMSIRLLLDVGAVGVVIGLGFGRIGCQLNGCCWGERCQSPLAITFPYGAPATDDHVREGWVKLPENLIEGFDRQGHAVPIERRVVENNPLLAAEARNVHSEAVQPTQIYSAISAFLVAGICFVFFLIGATPGRNFALMLILEGGTRFVIEAMRIEPTYLHTPLSLSMWISAALILLGVGLWFVLGLIHRPATQAADASPQAEPATAAT